MVIPLSIPNVTSRCSCYNIAKCRSPLNFCISLFKTECPLWLKRVKGGETGVRGDRREMRVRYVALQRS